MKLWAAGYRIFPKASESPRRSASYRRRARKAKARTAYTQLPPPTRSATASPRDGRRVAGNKSQNSNSSSGVYYGLYFYQLQGEIINNLIDTVDIFVDNYQLNNLALILSFDDFFRQKVIFAHFIFDSKLIKFVDNLSIDDILVIGKKRIERRTLLFQ